MIRRLLCACVGAAFMAMLAVPDRAAAKPPDLPEDGTFTAAPAAQEDAETTCPYLRQQRIDRHACQMADPEIGRDVLDNLKRLEEADKLLELAKDLASDGFLDQAIECCQQAADLCPGSPCAERAVTTMLDLMLGTADEQVLTMPNPKHKPDTAASEPGVEPMVSGLMKACHLLMDQGMQHQAAELARQAYALDPQRVAADPLVYKMHLLAESPVAQPAGSSEASEPPTCPYCPGAGKPIRAIVPEKRKKKSKAEDTSRVMPPVIESLPFEIAANAEGELRLNAEYALGGNVYHVRYRHGCLAIWKTADDSQMKP